MLLSTAQVGAYNDMPQGVGIQLLTRTVCVVVNFAGGM